MVALKRSRIGNLPLCILGCCYFLLLLLQGCTSKPAISGHIQLNAEDDQKYTLYVVQPSFLLDVGTSLRGTVLDSVPIVDGSFEIDKASLPTDRHLLELVLQTTDQKYPRLLQNEDPNQMNFIAIVWEPDTHLQFHSTADHFYADVTWESTIQDNEELFKLKNVQQKAYSDLLENKKWDIHEGSQLIEKEKAVLEYQEALMGFANKTPSFEAAMVALRCASPKGDYERIPEFLVQQCHRWESQTEHSWKTQLCDLADAKRLPVLVGEQFPMAVLPLSNGENQSLQALMGERLTLIDLWASWCVPCRKENRETLVPLWENRNKDGFQIVGYGLESNEEAWKAAIERDGVYRWTHASHLQGDDAPFLQTLRIQTIPANFLVDDKGMVIAKNLHGKELNDFVNGFLDSK